MTTENSSAPPPEISLIEAVWRYRYMSLAIIVLCGLLAVGATMVLFANATAVARLGITDPLTRDSLRGGVASGQGFSTYTTQRAAFARSAPVLERAAEHVRSESGKSYTLSEMRSRVETTSMADAGVVEVEATGHDMAEAAVTANAVVKSYRELSAEAIKERRSSQIENIRSSLKELTRKYESTPKGRGARAMLRQSVARLQDQEADLIVKSAKEEDGVQFVDEADPSAPAVSKLPRNTAVGLAVGVLLAGAVSFLRASSPGASAPRQRSRTSSKPHPGPAAAYRREDPQPGIQVWPPSEAEPDDEPVPDGTALTSWVSAQPEERNGAPAERNGSLAERNGSSTAPLPAVSSASSGRDNDGLSAEELEDAYRRPAAQKRSRRSGR